MSQLNAATDLVNLGGLEGSFGRPRARAVVLLGILVLFFFQMLSDFVAGLYGLGLRHTSIPPEIASMGLFLSPLLLGLFPKCFSSRQALTGLVFCILLARVLEVPLSPRAQMLVSGIGVAAFLVFLPALLVQDEEAGVLPFGLGLALALSLSLMLRALGTSFDPAAHGVFQVFGWALALSAGWLWLQVSPARVSSTPQAAGLGRIAAWSIGFASALTLLYFAFTTPQVIARWTDEDARFILAGTVVSLCAWTFFLAAGGVPSRKGLIAWNVVFVGALVLTIWLNQVRLPRLREAYPVVAPQNTLLVEIALVVMVSAFPISLVDCELFATALHRTHSTARTMGGAFSLGALWMLALILGQVLTTVYDYVPVVGPCFRDRFLMVFMAAGLGLAVPALALPKGQRALEAGRSKGIIIGVASVGGIALAAALVSVGHPAPLHGPGDRVRVLTYNVQQGYSADGLRNVEGQLEVIRRQAPDILGLQESDTARISGGNADMVGYLAAHLNLYSYYGPKTVTGTFGIALLSRYPIENPRTLFLFSVGEQTAAITAQVRVAGKRFTVLVTHLGNAGDLPQLEDLLSSLGGRERVILMGDFNFRPGTEQYRRATGVLRDAWVLAGSPVPGPDWSAGRRIDHMFVSTDVEVLDARYVLSMASDHPALWVEMR